MLSRPVGLLDFFHIVVWRWSEEETEHKMNSGFSEEMVQKWGHSVLKEKTSRVVWSSVGQCSNEMKVWVLLRNKPLSVENKIVLDRSISSSSTWILYSAYNCSRFWKINQRAYTTYNLCYWDPDWQRHKDYETVRIHANCFYDMYIFAKVSH